jgi:hypothetical protein
MAKLHLTPENNSYSVERHPETISARVGGGPSRYRRDILGNVFDVEVSFILDAEEYDYLMAFYRTATIHGSIPFEIDLITDSSGISEKTAYFAGGQPPKLTGQRGLAYYVSAQLEVFSPISDTETTDDNATIAAFEAAHGFV